MIIGTQKTQCALCGKTHLLQIVRERKSIQYKNQEVNYWATFYKCLNSPIDDNEFIGINQEKSNALNIINEYRKNNNLLTSDRIIEIREHYGLTASELSRILGWNSNLIDLYETVLAQERENDYVLMKIKNNPSFLYHRLKRTKNILNQNKLTQLNLLLLKEIKEKKDYFED